MPYSHADWQTRTTDAERLAAARAHYAEVEADITANLSSGGHSRSVDVLNNKLERLAREIEKLERRVPGAARAPTISDTRF